MFRKEHFLSRTPYTNSSGRKAIAMLFWSYYSTKGGSLGALYLFRCSILMEIITPFPTRKNRFWKDTRTYKPNFFLLRTWFSEANSFLKDWQYDHKRSAVWWTLICVPRSTLDIPPLGCILSWVVLTLRVVTLLWVCSPVRNRAT